MRERNWIERAQAVELIGSTGGEFFSAVTRKRTDGTFRKFNCRLGVKKGVKGVGMAFKPADYNLITVWDQYKKNFRMLAVDGLIMIKINGVKYYIKSEK